MNIEEFYNELTSIQEVVKSKGLNGEAFAYINWLGDEIRVTVKAGEDWAADNDYWHKEKHFDGGRTAERKLLDEAMTWAYSLPNEEDRVIEFMIQKLNELADKLPKGTSEIAMAAWEEIFNMLKKRAESISKSGLPSPVTISDVKRPTPSRNIPDDEIPFQ